jgi:hypothetical protein
MKEPINIIEYDEIKANFSDFKYFDYSTSRAPVGAYKNISIIVQALAEDILSVRKDKVATVVFSFSKTSFWIAIKWSYPFFHYDCTFNFEYDYPDLENNIQNILANELNNLIQRDSALHKPTDIIESYQFFNNLKIFESIFGIDNLLLEDLKQNPFKSGLSSTKGEFKFFSSEKKMNGFPEIVLSCPVFNVKIDPEALLFRFKNVNIEFKNPNSNINDILECQKIIISVFNLNSEFKITDTKSLFSMAEIISI